VSGAAPNAFGRGLALLVANPVIVLPALVIGVLAGLAGGAVAPPAAPIDTSDPTSLVAAQAGARYLGTVVVFGAMLFAGVLIDALTIGMAGAAWERGRTGLADLAVSLRASGARLVATVIVYAVAQAVLTVLTFGLGGLVFGFFALYVFAGVALGGRSFATALRESVALTGRRFASSLTLVVLLFAVAIVLSVGAAVIPFPPRVGALAAVVAVALLRAYANLVIAGEYRSAQGALAAKPKRSRP
jgi:hypothetical protein